MRLIDELTLQRELFCRIQENAIDSGTVHFDSYKNWCLSGSEVEKAIIDIFSQVGPFCPTIDPEAFPIVRELREKLERVKEDRDAAIRICIMHAHVRPVNCSILIDAHLKKRYGVM